MTISRDYVWIYNSKSVQQQLRPQMNIVVFLHLSSGYAAPKNEARGRGKGSSDLVWFQNEIGWSERDRKLFNIFNMFKFWNEKFWTTLDKSCSIFSSICGVQPTLRATQREQLMVLMLGRSEQREIAGWPGDLWVAESGSWCYWMLLV